MSTTSDQPRFTGTAEVPRETSAGAPLARIAIPVAGGFEIVPVEQIDWVESNGNYVQVHIAGEAKTVRSTLRALISRLDRAMFRQVHRTTVVNVTRIAGLRAGQNGDGTIVLTGGQVLRMSRRFRQGLLEVLL